MILLNFSHPLTPDHLAQIESFAGQPVTRVVEVRSQVDPQEALAPQVARLADEAGLTATQWQSEPLLVNPPALNYSAVLLLAELHGRMGYFPTCLRLRPVPGSSPPRFEVAELMAVQAMRDEARQRR